MALAALVAPLIILFGVVDVLTSLVRVGVISVLFFITLAVVLCFVSSLGGGVSFGIFKGLIFGGLLLVATVDFLPSSMGANNFEVSTGLAFDSLLPVGRVTGF